MSVVGPVQSRYREAVQYVKRNLRWEGFVEKVGFEPGVKERCVASVANVAKLQFNKRG